jgi:hypothetical protein
MKIKIEIQTESDYISTYIEINTHSIFLDVFKEIIDTKNKIINDNGLDKDIQAEVTISNKIKFFI